MDETARYHLARWQALADADALFTRAALDLDPDSARRMVDPEGYFGDLTDRRVLCLAAGGGKQSAAFALLGAHVTVADLSPAQLERDALVATAYNLPIAIVQADMRDLSAFDADAFDLVWQPYALNFIPDATVVFREVSRVLRPGGTYYLQCANPFGGEMTEADWHGDGYTMRGTYRDGEERTYEDQAWVYERTETTAVPPPREFRHTFATLINGLIAAGFTLTHVSDQKDLHPDPAAAPGIWDHFVSVMPPWLAFWAEKVR